MQRGKEVVIGEQLDLFGGPSTPVVWNRVRVKRAHDRGVIRGLRSALELALEHGIRPDSALVSEVEALIEEWRNK